MIDSFSLKTRDVTHVANPNGNTTLWHDSQNDANDFFLDNPEEEGDLMVEKRRERHLYHLSSVRLNSVAAKPPKKTLPDVRSNILFQPPKTSEKILKGLKICQTSYTGARRNDVKLLIERLGAAYSKLFDKMCTHLCCYQFEGKKYEKAASDGTTIVSHAWLEACYVSGEKGCVEVHEKWRGRGSVGAGEGRRSSIWKRRRKKKKKEEEEEEEEEEEIEDVIEDVVCVKDLEKNISTERKKNRTRRKRMQFKSKKTMKRRKFPLTEAQAKITGFLAYHKEEEEEKRKRKRKAPSSTGSKKYPSPDYNNLPPDQVERCVRVTSSIQRT